MTTKERSENAPEANLKRLEEQAEKTTGTSLQEDFTDDWTERWGKKLGAVIGYALALFLRWYLYRSYVAG